MRRLPLVFLTLAFAVLVSAPAHAKGVTKVTACGSSGCQDATPSAGHDTTLLETGPEVGPPSGQAAFYKLRATIGPPPPDAPEGMRVTMQYVPSAQVVSVAWPQEPVRWMQVSVRSGKAFDQAIAGLKPFAASKLDLSSGGTTPVPEARVVEVVPAPSPAAATSGDSDWLAWTLGAVAGLALIGGFWALLRRRRARPGLHPAG